MEILFLVVFGVVAGALAIWLYDRWSADAYWRAYDKAQQQDLEYHERHPGCTLQEAHQHRDKVMKKFGRY